jgi:tRNA dimethylallyltransferase
MIHQQPLLAIVGPTASGKSAVAQQIADATGASLISVDSRKVYRGMDIGTAKPSPEAIARYRYGMIDLCNPDRSFSAGDFSQQARALVAERLASDERVILVGGTGFYLDAFINGLADLPPVDDIVRAAVLAEAGRYGWPAIHDQLARIDPSWAAGISPQDRTRLQRAAEILAQTGKSPSLWQRELIPEPAPWEVRVFQIEHPTEELNQRIVARTDSMLRAGLVDEVQRLMAMGYTAASPGMATVGYQEVIPYLMGGASLIKVRQEIIVHTRQYAKRQRTWFRHRPYVQTIPYESEIWRKILAQFNSTVP